jgi:hypothetical protein
MIFSENRFRLFGIMPLRRPGEHGVGDVQSVRYQTTSVIGAGRFGSSIAAHLEHNRAPFPHLALPVE